MKIFKLLVIAGLSFFISVGVAGVVQPAPVLVQIETDLSGLAQGDMLTAKNSKNSIDIIGCGSRTINEGTGTFEFGFCQAVMDDGTEEGLNGFCSTNDPTLINAIGRLSDYAYVIFAWNASGQCTRVGSSTQSFYLPEVKSSKASN